MHSEYPWELDLLEQLGAQGKLTISVALQIAKAPAILWHAVGRMSADSVVEVWDTRPAEPVRLEPWQVAALVRGRLGRSTETAPADDALELRIGPRFDLVWPT